MDINSVIMLGHSPNVPLIGASSELSDGLEPHALKLSVRAAAGCMTAVQVGEGCTRGGCRPGGYQGGVYRVPSQPVRLRLI